MRGGARARLDVGAPKSRDEAAPARSLGSAPVSRRPAPRPSHSVATLALEPPRPPQPTGLRTHNFHRSAVEFASYMSSEGYSIIPIPGAHQLQYACNVLNLGGSRIVSVHAPSARQIVQHPAFKGDVRVIDFSSITSMYGSVHCASQARARRRGSGWG